MMIDGDEGWNQSGITAQRGQVFAYQWLDRMGQDKVLQAQIYRTTQICGQNIVFSQCPCELTADQDQASNDENCSAINSVTNMYDN